MKCPICNSEDYDCVDIDECDGEECRIMFKCRGSCGNVFYGEYEIKRFKDEDDNIVGMQYYL